MNLTEKHANKVAEIETVYAEMQDARAELDECFLNSREMNNPSFYADNARKRFAENVERHQTLLSEIENLESEMCEAEIEIPKWDYTKHDFASYRI